jgi:geranylgeranyl pyrophosphate synthase
VDQLQAFKQYFEPRYQAFLQAHIEPYMAQPLIEEMCKHLLVLAGGGKRLRPYVAMLAYHSAEGADPESFLTVLYALELYHLFALIHDDIIDEAITRHGVLCIHTKYGVSQALLLGDLILSIAMSTVGNSTMSTLTRETFSRLSEETIVGQMIDVAMTDKLDIDILVLNTAIEQKTARYSFAYPMVLGITQANSNLNTDTYWNLGIHLGRAFQRIDNIADVLETEASLGKKPCADIMQGTPTHLTHYLMHHGTASQQALLEKQFGKKVKDTGPLRDAFIHSGAIAHEKLEVVSELEEARNILHALQIEQTLKNSWADCIGMLELKVKTLSH